MVETAPGHSYPIGATVTVEGVNFCVYSRHATCIDLVLFAQVGDLAPAATITLNPAENRTGFYWHVLVRGIGAGQVYGYRAYGPYDPGRGLRFDATKLLLDPYARAVANVENYQRLSAGAPADNLALALQSVVVDPAAYDWEGDQPLCRVLVDAVIYEMHVGGFTRNPNSGVAEARRGTYAGVIDKIPYLLDLGIQSVELMPVQQFDAQDAPVLSNYWGYQPVAWFAPHRAYSSARDLLGPVNEFRDMVKALHRAGIEVILDVIFNHTAEGNEQGPTLSLRGFDNPTYYILDPADRSRYIDDTGCGHTINGNETVVRRMILDCLRYWVEHMHVDGFRFDLASSLSRGEDGTPLEKPPILLDIDADPVLAGATIIAEAWDSAGLYQVANFAGDRWAVWNGEFRDHVRQFFKGDRETVGRLGDALLGGESLFHQPGRDPNRSINFVTAHDGFTLNDLVSYDTKRNQANGEDNRDGSDTNYSWNCGVEGPTSDPAIEMLRRRQIRNLLTILLTSQGRPMLLMGDEVRRTQAGNNNAYCQDNPLSWFDWNQVNEHADVLRFARGLIRFHQQSAIFRDRSFWGQPGAPSVAWHGIHLNQPDWGADSHTLACELFDGSSGEHLHLLFNAYWEAVTFDLPTAAVGRAWHRLGDTGQASPNDFADPTVPVAGAAYSCVTRSAVILIAKEDTP